MSRALLDHRVIVVTGKGGVGKTSVACALAEVARQTGQRVLLAETAGIESIAGRFDTNAEPLGYTGRTLRPGLQALRIDPHEALADYVRLQTGLGAITDRVLRSETFQHLLNAAPGWRELIILGKIWHLEQKCDARGHPLYDLIVVDAPATGHGLTFLDVPRVVQQAIQTGPLARHSSWVEALVHDRERTLLLPVTLAEELPVTETAELVERARQAIDIGVDRIVINRSNPAASDLASISLERLPQDLHLASLPPVPKLIELVDHARHRSELAQTQRHRVSTLCDLPIIDFPEISEGFTAATDWESHTERLLTPPIWPSTQHGPDSSS